MPDPIDGLRAWADGADVRTGRRTSQRLVNSAAGRKILAEPQGGPQIRAALRWIFAQAQGRRWDAVPWGEVDRLEEALLPHYQAPDREVGSPGLYWRPGAPGSVADRLEELEPSELLELGRWESGDELRRTLAELVETYAVARECLSPPMRRLVERRIAEWETWADDPQRIPEYACEPDRASGGYVCNYPIVIGELRELRGACQYAYDPDWAAREAGEPGFPPKPRQPWDRDAPPAEDLGEREAEPRDDAPLLVDPDERATGECAPIGLRQLEEGGRAFGAASRWVEDRREAGGIWYQLETVTCGNKGCRCYGGERHGPYWYAFWIMPTGRRRSKYLGRKWRRYDPDEG